MRPPDAQRPRREGEGTHGPGEETQAQRTARLIFGRHNRHECIARSHSHGPCGRCCRCIRNCTHPAFMSEVA